MKETQDFAEQWPLTHPHPLRGYNEHACSFCMGVLPGWGSSNYVLIPSFKMLRDVLCFENNKLLTKEELLMTPNNINLIVSFFLD